MRLIDADALIERCKARESDPWLKNITAESWAKAYAAFREEIDRMPTVEAKRGKDIGERIEKFGFHFFIIVSGIIFPPLLIYVIYLIGKEIIGW